MYAIPLLAFLVLALVAVAWSPLFALVIFVVGFLAFLVFAGLRPRADELPGKGVRGAERGTHEPSDREAEAP